MSTWSAAISWDTAGVFSPPGTSSTSTPPSAKAPFCSARYHAAHSTSWVQLKPNLIGSVAVAPAGSSDPVAAEPPHAAVTASASVVPRTPAIRPSRAGTPARVMIRPLSKMLMR
jgi:hypothetical protein